MLRSIVTTAVLFFSFLAFPLSAADLILRDTPCRLFDSRNIGGTGAGPKITSATIDTWGTPGASQGGEPGCGIPYGASGAAINLTVYQPNGPGWVKLWRFGSAQPLSTSLSFASGQLDECAGLLVGVGLQDGKISLSSPWGGAHFIVEVAGWIDGGGGGGFPAPRQLRALSFVNAPVAGMEPGGRLIIIDATAVPFIGHDNEYVVWKGIPSCDPSDAACWSFESPRDGDLAFVASGGLGSGSIYWRFRELGFEDWEVVGPWPH